MQDRPTWMVVVFDTAVGQQLDSALTEHWLQDSRHVPRGWSKKLLR